MPSETEGGDEPIIRLTAADISDLVSREVAKAVDRVRRDLQPASPQPAKRQRSFDYGDDIDKEARLQKRYGADYVPPQFRYRRP